jgi:hypothetical protein
MLHKAYNIATINENLLAKMTHELDAREVRANLKQVCLDSRESLYKTNITPPLPLSCNLPAFANCAWPTLLPLIPPLLSPLLPTPLIFSTLALHTTVWLLTYPDRPGSCQPVPANRTWAAVYVRCTRSVTLTVCLTSSCRLGKGSAASMLQVAVQGEVATVQPEQRNQTVSSFLQ